MKIRCHVTSAVETIQDTPRHSGPGTEWHHRQVWDMHIMSQTRAIHQLQTEPGCDRSPPGRLRKGWKLSHPSIPHQPQHTVDINIISFLFCQGQFSLHLKSTPSREGRKYSAACLNRTPDHDNNMDREETRNGFMHHQQKTKHFRLSQILHLPSRGRPFFRDPAYTFCPVLLNDDSG